MRTLVTEITRACLPNIPPNLTAEQFDQVLFQAVRRFIVALQQSIEKAESRVKFSVLPYFKEDGYKTLINPFAKTTSQTRNDVGFSVDMVDGLRDIFQMPQQDHLRSVQEARRRRSEFVVYAELNEMMALLQRDRMPGHYALDFPDKAYSTFKQRETARITGLRLAFEQRFEAVKKTPLPPGTRIPPPLGVEEAETLYKALVDFCYDAEIASNGQGASNVSKLSRSILSECAFRWHISKDFKEIAVFEAMVRKYNQGALVLEDLYPKFREIRKIVSNQSMLRFRDAALLVSIYEKIHKALLNQVQEFLEFIHQKSRTPDDCTSLLRLCTYMLQEINDEPLWRERYPEAANPDYIVETIREQIAEAATERLVHITKKLDSVFADKDQQTVRLTKLLQAVKSDINKYRTYFPEPFFGDCRIHVIAGEVYLKNVNGEVLNIHYMSPDVDITQMLDLYVTARDLYDLSAEVNINVGTNVEIDSLFAPYIEQWLTRTDAKWIEWVVRAYELDERAQFEQVLPPRALNSTSVLDLFSSFQSGLEFMAQFNFTDTNKRERLARSFIKAMGKALQEYCRLVFADFEAIDQTQGKAKFSAQICTKSNNIFTAQQNLRKVLSALKVAEKSAMEVSSSARRIHENPGFQQFSLKLIRAQNIAAKDWATSNPFVRVLVGGREIGASRVIDATVNPVWNETAYMDIPMAASEAEAQLTLLAMHFNNLGTDIELGRASLSLIDPEYDDFLSHDLQFPLNPGVLSVRVRKIGEIDDTAWYIKRAEELLRFAIEDMLRIYVGKTVDLVKEQVKRIVADSKPTLFSFAFSREIEITDAWVEKAMVPMLTDLDHTLSVLNQNIDRRYEQQLIELYPHLAPNKPDSGDANADGNGAATAGAVHRTPTQSGNPPSEAGDLDEDNVNTEMPPGLVRLIWYELLRAFEAQLRQFGVEGAKQAQKPAPAASGADGSAAAPVVLSADEKRMTRIIERVVEFLKSMFYCADGEGHPDGLHLEDLETPKYLEVRALLDEYMRQIEPAAR
nr:hypothetical protein HK105_006815 [Polyrhizophydium stewartii]